MPLARVIVATLRVSLNLMFGVPLLLQLEECSPLINASSYAAFEQSAQCRKSALRWSS
jgi:hypothetical protein